MVLATDMAFHFADLGKVKVRLTSHDFDPKSKDKLQCMESLLHGADISNPTKPFPIYEKWAKRVLEEFWQQGDMERNQSIPISQLCDRFTTNTAKSQMGFIEFVVAPYYEVLKQFLPELLVVTKQIESNKNEWKDKVAFYDEELKKMQK